MKKKINILEIIILIIMFSLVGYFYFINSKYLDLKVSNGIKTKEIKKIDNKIKNHNNYMVMSNYGDLIFAINNLYLYKKSLPNYGIYYLDLKNTLPKDKNKALISNFGYNELEKTFSFGINSNDQYTLLSVLDELNKYKGFTELNFGNIAVKEEKNNNKIDKKTYEVNVVAKISQEYIKNNNININNEFIDSNQVSDILKIN